MGLAICKEDDHEAKKDDPLERKALEDLYKGMNGNQWEDYKNDDLVYYFCSQKEIDIIKL